LFSFFHPLHFQRDDKADVVSWSIVSDKTQNAIFDTESAARESELILGDCRIVQQ
jgi:hypothetical protein